MSCGRNAQAMKDTISGGPIEEAMRLLSGAVTHVADLLSDRRPKRFSDLRRDSPKISRRMSTLDLRELEAAGVVSRRLPGRAAARRLYAHRRGRKLVPLIDALGGWQEQFDHSRHLRCPVF